jgi:hypothetical protein
MLEFLVYLMAEFERYVFHTAHVRLMTVPDIYLSDRLIFIEASVVQADVGDTCLLD